MKKVLTLTLAVLMIMACLAGCGSKTNVLKVATSPDFPPFEFLDGTKVVGIEVELLELICKELKMELQLEQIDFDSVLLGVTSGKYKAGASGISVDDERKQNMLFTTPYCLAAQAIVVLEGSEIAAKADLEGKSVAVQTATTAEKFCMNAGYTVKSFTANADAQLALTGGKVDAWVIDDLTAAEMVAVYNATNPEKKLVVLSEAMTTEPYAFAFAKGQDELVAKIDPILKKLLSDGTVKGLFDKYNAPYTAPEN